ncbi:Icc protein [Isorropodon fossajaponicum endosymbiont JTNG4]|uniref:metallophosphoesterase family protein n=1 Tax=Isorropodon fossajaponicum symbiont TaxID=883811 RepID=UPI0019157974|nr:metallophosphoesterase [Isorropodon fossajaponicum symbiont]BBB24217.1 Icc protein [Isorropodon fossajaponicum endosymbiont JTNG4]
MSHSFIQISDCHIDDVEHAMGINTHVNLKKIINKIININTDALLISGDLTHNGTITAYKTLQQILSPVQTRLLVISGNHDINNNLNAIFSKNLFSQFTLGKWAIISANSVQTSKTSGFLTKDELIKLDFSLAQSTAKHILIVLHHPIVPMNSAWDDSLSLENPKALFNMLDKYPKIQAILFGHAHQAAEFSRLGVKIISCPSTALQFNNETRIGFNHYTLHDNGQLTIDTQWI